MSIAWQHAIDDDTFHVIATGHDDKLRAVIRYGQAVIALAREHRVTRVLCGERALDYALGRVDRHERARTIAAEVPEPLRVAIACRPEFLAAARFRETVAVNCGPGARVDSDIGHARASLARVPGMA